MDKRKMNNQIQKAPISFKVLMECHPDNGKNFDRLIHLMRKNVVVPFVGAGFSANYGYPTWITFLQEQAKAYNVEGVEAAIESKEYEKAASILKIKLGAGLKNVLTNTFGDHFYKNSNESPELEELTKVFSNLILTTNFDIVIEMLYAKVNGERIKPVTPNSLTEVSLIHRRIACGDSTLIKLHGDVDTREFVFTEDEYNKTYGEYSLDTKLPLPAFLRDVLLSKTILFLGCSLEDDRMLRVIEQAQIEGSLSFALVELPDDTANNTNPWHPKLYDSADGKKSEFQKLTIRKSFFNAHNIIPIWFPHGEHAALKCFLKAISLRTNSEYNFSTTVIRGRLNDLLAKGEALSKTKDIEQAFQCYANAAEIIKKNPDVFKPEKRLGELRKIRSFYESNGYIFESGELIKQILVLTEQIYSPESIELAKCYHEIGYTYERYLYYKLMLRAMLRSHEILEKCANIPEKHTDFLNAAALIYISLGYAYLENNDPDNAKIWYQKADELRRHHEQELDKSQKAFLYNGLHRYYYSILKDSKEALCMLNIALALRKELNKERDFNDVVTRVIPVHIINTHSNKIHIYLEEGQTGDAEKEFNDFQDARGALVGRKDLHDSERRILTDHGDVLTACGNHQDAYAEYQKALQHRKYLHFADDIFAAELYWKIGNSLKHITGSGNAERALEYLIQSHTIYRKILGADNKNAHETWEDILSLGKLLGYTEDIISKRHAAQLEFLEYRYDDRKDNRETELIEFYKL